VKWAGVGLSVDVEVEVDWMVSSWSGSDRTRKSYDLPYLRLDGFEATN
jgi:hypothetical protein